MPKRARKVSRGVSSPLLSPCRTEIFSGKTVTHEDIKYEQACILYNLGEGLNHSCAPGGALNTRCWGFAASLGLLCAECLCLEPAARRFGAKLPVFGVLSPVWALR